MSDAGELLLGMYEHVMEAAPSAGAALAAAFGLAVAEAVQCAKCGRSTQQVAYTQVTEGSGRWLVAQGEQPAAGQAAP